MQTSEYENQMFELEPWYENPWQGHGSVTPEWVLGPNSNQLDFNVGTTTNKTDYHWIFRFHHLHYHSNENLLHGLKECMGANLTISSYFIFIAKHNYQSPEVLRKPKTKVDDYLIISKLVRHHQPFFCSSLFFWPFFFWNILFQ